MSISEYKPCLNVYVVWRPEPDAAGADKSRGLELARLIYSIFARDIEKPLNNGLGVPVFFRAAAASKSERTPPLIKLEQAERSAVVLLVSSGMVTDPAWDPYVAELSGR